MAVLQCEKTPSSEAFLSGSPGTGSTESARIAPASSRTWCAASTHSTVHWPWLSVQPMSCRYLTRPQQAESASFCAHSKQRPCSSGLPRRRCRSCSASLVPKLPLLACVSGTSHSSITSVSFVISADCSSAGSRHSLVPCWQTKDSSDEKCSSSSNSLMRMVRTWLG